MPNQAIQHRHKQLLTTDDMVNELNESVLFSHQDRYSTEQHESSAKFVRFYTTASFFEKMKYSQTYVSIKSGGRCETEAKVKSFQCIIRYTSQFMEAQKY